MNMTGCILGSQYIPSAEYFAHWIHHGTITLEMHEHYQKRSWRNKTAILGPDVPLILTVPLQKGKHQQKNIRDVKIAYDEPWAAKQLHSIKTAYGKTAFFDEIWPGLKMHLLSGCPTLWELNLNLLEYITGLLPGSWNKVWTETFIREYPPSVSDLRSGIPAGRVSLTERTWPSYPQVQRLGKAHQPNLSILDALCHLGPETVSYLRQYAEKLYETS